jgi:hypothetical protein
VSLHAPQVRYGEVDREYVARMAAVTTEDDGPFLMLNLMRYRDWADYGDDRPPITGREADALYAPLEMLADAGAEVVLVGDVDEQPRGDERWDRVALVRYPTAHSFLEMQQRIDFLARHVHKDAGVERTVIAACHPLDGTLGSGSRLVVDLVAEDPAHEPRPGEVRYRVDGVPVGDGRPWSTLAITAVEDDAPVEPVETSGDATTVVVTPFLDGLR